VKIQCGFELPLIFPLGTPVAILQCQLIAFVQEKNQSMFNPAFIEYSMHFFLAAV